MDLGDSTGSGEPTDSEDLEGLEGAGARAVSMAKSVEVMVKRVVGRVEPVADLAQGVADAVQSTVEMVQGTV